jgi:protein-tyrosine phosphatase
LPLLFHCTAGKDRTGWLAAIVLSALDVDRDTVLADYLRTTELNANGRDYMLSNLSERIASPDVVLPLIEARVEYLQAAFDEADSRFGGMDGYLRDGLGLDDAVLASLRANLLI